LSKIQTKRIEDIKEKINQKIDNFDSTLNRNLSKLFDHIF
jgi:hypothetical protein